MMIYALKPNIRRKPLRLLAFLLLVLGVGLWTAGGMTRLACKRNVATVQCTVKQTFSFGIISKSSETIDDVKSAQLDEQVRKVHDQPTQAAPPNAREKKAYGIFLTGNKQVLLNGYDYDRDRQEKRLQKINAFLNISSQQHMELEIKNIGTFVITLVVFGGAIALFLIPDKQPEKRSQRIKDGVEQRML